MINAKDSQIILEERYANGVTFWEDQNEVNDKVEALRRSLEDLIKIYKVNNGCLHDPYTVKGDKLDRQTTIDFLKYRCQDLYGKEWEKHWKEYNIV